MPHWRRMCLLGLLLLVSGGSRIAPAAKAADLRCFDAPGITNCIGGAFRTYWEAHGGLATFGYPLTAELSETTPDGTYTIQYFERVRFEYHPENPPEFQVQLGRLGAELYSPIIPIPEFSQPGCRFFAETGYNVCEPFLTKWSSVGNKTGAGNLDLYGLPIGPLQVSYNAAGDPVSTQWFERARFELHNGNQILLGLLGRERLAQSNTPAPAPPPAPPAEPAPPVPAEPTPVLPAPIEAPFPDRPCHVNVPAPIEGLQAWATLPEVSSPFDQVICVRLIVNGEPAHPAFAKVYRYMPDGVVPSIGHTTGFDGTTGFIFYIGDVPVNATIPVEAVVTFEGREYRAWTSFIRR